MNSCSHVKANIAPRFEFGFGLSYTTFDYSNLKITGSTAGGTRQPNGPGAALDPWLHDAVVTVSFTLTNNGSVAGAEVCLSQLAWLYALTIPPAIDPAALHVSAGFRQVCAVQP